MAAPARSPTRPPLEYCRWEAGWESGPVHAHADKVARLRQIDFGPKHKVEEGAIVKIMGLYFVIAVATDRFVCEGTELMGVSVRTPLFQAIAGKAAGDAMTFNGRDFVVDLVV